MCGERTRLGRIFHKNCERQWIAERVRRSAESSEKTHGVKLNQAIKAAYAMSCCTISHPKERETQIRYCTGSNALPCARQAILGSVQEKRIF